MDRLKADMRELGFGMFEGALDPKTTARVRERVLEQDAAGRRIDYGTTNLRVEPDDDVNQRVAFVPNKGQVFRMLINNDRVLEIVRFILGEDAILSEFSAHVTWPGNKEMGLRPEVADDLTEHESALNGRAVRRRGQVCVNTVQIRPGNCFAAAAAVAMLEANCGYGPGSSCACRIVHTDTIAVGDGACLG